MYAVFIAYMSLSLLWAPDAVLGLNTLIPSFNFLLLMILYGSLIAFHDVRSVLTGLFGGFLLGAAAYTYREGFPFSYPPEFSYNAVASMYLFGLFITLIFGWRMGSRALTLSVAFVVILHIVATTSIKTNLGVLIGVVAAGAVFAGRFSRLVIRNVPIAIAVAGLLAYAVISNESVFARAGAGLERVTKGVAIIQSGQDTSASTSFGLRQKWVELGIEGWRSSPVFGHGVEAFRKDYGITSHSTPVDLLYNTGLIGFLLFYGIFASLAWRLFKIRESAASGLRPLLFAGLTCHFFITFSGTTFYQAFLGIFVALSVALLRPGGYEMSKPASPGIGTH